MNEFKIKVGRTSAESSIELNGVPLEGVISVKFELTGSTREEMPFLRLEIYGNVTVEGEPAERVTILGDQS